MFEYLNRLLIIRGEHVIWSFVTRTATVFALLLPIKTI